MSAFLCWDAEGENAQPPIPGLPGRSQLGFTGNGPALGLPSAIQPTVLDFVGQALGPARGVPPVSGGSRAWDLDSVAVQSRASPFPVGPVPPLTGPPGHARLSPEMQLTQGNGGQGQAITHAASRGTMDPVAEGASSAQIRRSIDELEEVVLRGGGGEQGDGGEARREREAGPRTAMLVEAALKPLGEASVGVAGHGRMDGRMGGVLGHEGTGNGGLGFHREMQLRFGDRDEVLLQGNRQGAKDEEEMVQEEGFMDGVHGRPHGRDGEESRPREAGRVLGVLQGRGLASGRLQGIDAGVGGPSGALVPLSESARHQIASGLLPSLTALFGTGPHHEGAPRLAEDGSNWGSVPGLRESALGDPDGRTTNVQWGLGGRDGVMVEGAVRKERQSRAGRLASGGLNRASQDHSVGPEGGMGRHHLSQRLGADLCGGLGCTPELREELQRQSRALVDDSRRLHLQASRHAAAETEEGGVPRLPLGRELGRLLVALGVPGADAGTGRPGAEKQEEGWGAPEVEQSWNVGRLVHAGHGGSGEWQQVRIGRGEDGAPVLGRAAGAGPGAVGVGGSLVPEEYEGNAVVTAKRTGSAQGVEGEDGASGSAAAAVAALGLGLQASGVDQSRPRAAAAAAAATAASMNASGEANAAVVATFGMRGEGRRGGAMVHEREGAGERKVGKEWQGEREWVRGGQREGATAYDEVGREASGARKGHPWLPCAPGRGIGEAHVRLTGRRAEGGREEPRQGLMGGREACEDEVESRHSSGGGPQQCPGLALDGIQSVHQREDVGIEERGDEEGAKMGGEGGDGGEGCQVSGRRAAAARMAAAVRMAAYLEADMLEEGEERTAESSHSVSSPSDLWASGDAAAGAAGGLAPRRQRRRLNSGTGYGMSESGVRFGVPEAFRREYGDPAWLRMQGGGAGVGSMGHDGGAGPGLSRAARRLNAGGGVMVRDSGEAFEIVPFSGPVEFLYGRVTQLAQAQEDSDLPLFRERFKWLSQYANPSGQPVERAIHYNLLGLLLRCTGMGYSAFNSPIQRPVEDLKRAFMWYGRSSPLARFSHVSTMSCVCSALAGQPNIHIIEFGQQMLPQWPSVMRLLSRLPSSAPRALRLTLINTIRLISPGRTDLHQVAATADRGAWLREQAAACGIAFELEELALDRDNLLLLMRMVRRSGDALAVVSSFDFDYFLDSSVLEYGIRETLLQWVGSLRPTVCTMTSIDIQANTEPFMTRFKALLEHQKAVFNANESVVDAASRDLLTMCEEARIGRGMVNMISCCGAERLCRPLALDQWEVCYADAGLVPGTIAGVDVSYATLKGFADGFGLQVEQNSIRLTWQGTSILALSVWVPRSPRYAM